jgi:hypothetical protein
MSLDSHSHVNLLLDCQSVTPIYFLTTLFVGVDAPKQKEHGKNCKSIIDWQNQDFTMRPQKLTLPMFLCIATVSAFSQLTQCGVLGPIPTDRHSAYLPWLIEAGRHNTRLNAVDEDAWNGGIVSGQDGKIGGCSILLQEGKLTDWEVVIDGVEADLGRFSEAIYKKLMQDAKQQRFQGFRPGTIPPHLEPTYRVFAMDECARETVLEAMQQNNIRPFDSTRVEMTISNIKIPPVTEKKKKSTKRKKAAQDAAAIQEESQSEEPLWRDFATMKEAINAGWRPGQSFSFVARGVRGQQVKGEEETQRARPLGLDY